MLARYELNRERDETIFAGAECDNVCNVHFHRKVEVMYVLEGEKKIFASGKELTLRGDNIYFANSYEMHGYAESPGSRQTVIVFPNLMLRDFYDVFGDKIMNGCVVDDAGFCRSVLPHFEALAEGKCNKLVMQAHCDMLLGSVAEKLGYSEGTRGRQGFVDGLLAYINEHYADEINLDVMAEVSECVMYAAGNVEYQERLEELASQGLTSTEGFVVADCEYYFSRMFNDALGTSITDYVSAVRLMHTLETMKSKGCTASEAALECGFSSIPTFYRVLKKNYNYKAVKDLL